MKKIFYLIFLLLYSLSTHAFPLDEQDISTQDGTCKLHYLSNKTKNLWTIDVNKTFCIDGWVQGFASVSIKDQLGRLTETLNGYFHQGYWLDGYGRDIKTFYRSSPAEHIQSFIFPFYEDEDLDATYLVDARSLQTGNAPYPAFEVCGDQPYLLVAHKETDDFKKSLFQSLLLKNAQIQIKKLCPKSKKMTILGVKELASSESDWAFRADIDLQTNETTLRYPQGSQGIPHPMEIRREESENLVTITPKGNATPTVSYKETLPMPITQEDKTAVLEKLTIPWDDTKTIRSAIDLDLMARVLPDGAAGKTVVHIQSVQLDQSAIVDLPTSLIIEQAHNLNPGWHIIVGHFRSEHRQTRVKVSQASPCKKEGCTDAF